MSYSEYEMINSYLIQVRKKLPEWLKLKKVEVEKILRDLEYEILNEAKNIANGQEPTDMDIQQALIQIGSPEGIAKEYKRRGTPRLYITEELLDFYIRTMLFFFLIVIGINILVSIFQFIFLAKNFRRYVYWYVDRLLDNCYSDYCTICLFFYAGIFT